MYICRRVHSERNLNGALAIFEATGPVLDSFLECAAAPGSQASRDAALMTLTNGAEVRSCHTNGVTWFRVHKPMVFTPTPTECQITKARLGAVMYDGKTKHGPWAIMDEKAWKLYGCGRLGAGFGQKYRRNEAGEFYISEGMSSRPMAFRVNAA